MRTLAMAFLFCLISSIANAETFQLRKVMICDKSEIIFEKLAKDFQEYPIWNGKDQQDDSYYALTVNRQSGSWTLVQFFKDIACVLGVGYDSKLATESST